MKSRKQKEKIYDQKYSSIPRDYMERLSWMYDKYHMTKDKADNIIDCRNRMLQQLQFSQEIFVVLYEEPEGSPRPRARLVTKNNMISSAISNPNFIQIYSLTGASDRNFMKRLITEEDMIQLNNLICTPCNVDYTAFFKTPSYFNVTEVYLAEMGCIRPINKPDFDNIEKKYSDMYNGNVWIDDSLVVDSSIHKYYSILPRVEIRLRFLNLLYNKYQYKSMINKVEDPDCVDYFKL